MSNSQILRLAILGLPILGLTACSTIKSWFPDKERDYQFTTEIAELKVPDDLKAGGITNPPPAAEAAQVPVDETPEFQEAEQPVETPTEPTPVATKPEESGDSPSPAPTAAGGSSLQIDQAQKQAARIVARAMSRQKLEIVERNIDKGYFYVKYDPNAVKAEDKTIADELNFFFGDDPSQEQEYRVTLHELNAQLTEVTVQDSAGKTLSNATANSLLKLITDGINNDIPKEEPAAENPENKDNAASESGTNAAEAKPAEQPENKQDAPSTPASEKTLQDSKPEPAPENSGQDTKVPVE